MPKQFLVDVLVVLSVDRKKVWWLKEHPFSALPPAPRLGVTPVAVFAFRPPIHHPAHQHGGLWVRRGVSVNGAAARRRRRVRRPSGDEAG